MALTHYRVYDSVAAGDGSGDSWANAMTLAQLETHMEALSGGVLAGNIYWIMEDTYTLTNDFLVTDDGTLTEPGMFIGVKAETTNESPVFSDWAVDKADQPNFVCGGYELRFDNYMRFACISSSHNNDLGLSADVGAVFWNCYVDLKRTGAGAGYGLSVTTNSSVINCHIEKTGTGTACAAVFGSNATKYINNYFEGDPTNKYTTTLYSTGYDSMIVGNIFTYAEQAIFAGTSDPNYLVLNNTFYECDEAIDANSGVLSWVIMNNIFDTSDTTAIDVYEDRGAFFLMGNNFHSNTADYNSGNCNTYPYDDQYETAYNPTFTTDGSDFSLQSGSSCIGAGKTIEYGVG